VYCRSYGKLQAYINPNQSPCVLSKLWKTSGLHQSKLKSVCTVEAMENFRPTSIQIKVRVYSRSYGKIQAYISPNQSPCAQSKLWKNSGLHQSKSKSVCTVETMENFRPTSIQIKVRVYSRSYGKLQAYITPNQTPCVQSKLWKTSGLYHSKLKSVCTVETMENFDRKIKNPLFFIICISTRTQGS
jgi:ABC-type cobalamin transport system ATPase subunit